MIKLTAAWLDAKSNWTSGDSAVWIRANRLVLMQAAGGVTRVVLSGAEAIFVKETPEEIVSLIAVAAGVYEVPL